MSERRDLALVTGASAGIGVELARCLARQGHDLVLVARSEERLRRLADEVSAAHGVEALSVPLDLTRHEARLELARRVDMLGQPLDVLVNNAGFGTFGRFHEIDVDDNVDLVRLNIAALTHLTGLFLPAMVERRRGRVLNVASTAAFQPGPLMATYYASKAYVLHFSEALFEELDGSGVAVSCLCPGPTRTEFHERADMQDSGLLREGWLMDAKTVAEAGIRGLMRGDRVVIPGFYNRLLTWVVKLSPRSMVLKSVKRMQSRRD